jgi:hypothetical protein
LKFGSTAVEIWTIHAGRKPEPRYRRTPRDRDESLIDVASNCRHLPGEDAEVAREIVLAGAIAGLDTAGESA